VKLSIFHRTRYDYGSPVKGSFNEARLQPVSDGGQTCHSFSLQVWPSPEFRLYRDYYGNIVHCFELPEPHSCLQVESKAVVSTRPSSLPEDSELAPLTDLSGLANNPECFDFLQTSSMLSVDAEVGRLARKAALHPHAANGHRPPPKNVWQTALALRRFIHANFTYSPQTTDADTPMNEVLRTRRGVCQDFAHVMIGMCRALQIPARYVSGYIYNGPHDHLLGSQASHAWCEIYLPGFGWRGLDPTNNTQADEHHVKIGVGRDYADIIPVKGHYHGTNQKTMTIEVEIAETF
jgi:transglutaminase-like putative cysteine protease